MARIYTKQALLDPSMLAQDAAYRKSIVDAANQNRIQAAQSVGQGLSSFGKGLGDVIGQGIGVATRYDEYNDLLKKYGDDPMAKAAAWKFLYGGDPSAIQNYIAVKDTAAGARTADEARLKTLREQIKTASTEELRMKLIGEYNVIAAKYSDIPEYSPAETSAQTSETKTESTEAQTSTEAVSTEPSLKTIKDYNEHFIHTTWNSLDDLENFEKSLKSSGLRWEDVDKLLGKIKSAKDEIQKATESAESKRAKEEEKAAKEAAEEAKKQFERDVLAIKDMDKGEEKLARMKEANMKAVEIGEKPPFDENAQKNAVEAPKPVEKWDLNKQGTYNFYKNGKFIKTVMERGER